MAVVDVSIAGTTVQPNVGGLTIEQTLGSRHICSIEWADPTGAGLHPALGDEVLVTDTDSVRLFGGIVDSIRESGLSSPSLVALTRSVVAKDFGAYCDQRIVNADFSSATLKSVLLDLTSDYLSTFGISVSNAQADGANLGELSYDYRVLTDVLNDLAIRSGFTWNVSYDKVLRMTTAGTLAAPTVINSTNRVALEIQWEQSRENYANRQYISYGPTGSQYLEDYWTATTGQQDFPLHYEGVTASWVALENGVYLPVADSSASGTLYYYNSAVANTLYRTSSGLANGAAIRFQIQVPFPQITYVDAAAHSSDPYEVANVVSALADGTDYLAAQALATAYLTAVGTGLARRVRFITRTAGFQVGQVVTITMADRHLSGTHLITSVICDHVPGTANELSYAVECVSGDYSQGTFLDTYRNWSGAAGTGAGVALGGVAPSTAAATVSSLHAHLGGSRSELIASTAWTPVVNYQTFTAPVTGTYVLRTERAAETTAVTASVRLWDVTNSSDVSGSASTASASTSWLEASASVSLEAGHKYRVELLGDSATLGVQVGQATLEL